MSHTKKIIAFWLINTLLCPFVYAVSENPIEIQYITKSTTWENTYNLYLKNQPTSLSDAKLYINDVLNANTNLRLKLSSDNLEVGNFFKNSAKFSVEKFVTNNIEGVISNTSDSKTKNIEMRNLDSIYFLGDVWVETVGWNTLYVFPIQSNIEYATFWEKTYQLDINGQVFPLEYDMWNYVDGKYYISKGKIKFFSKNVDKNISNIKLKVDGVYSNSMILNKETIELSKINSITLENGMSTKEIRVHIAKGTALNSLKNVDVYMNNVLVDTNNVTLVAWEIIIKVDISKKIDDILEFYVKDKTQNTYSNKIAVNITKFTTPSITQLDFWKDFPKNQTFDFRISWNALDGDLYALELNLNGTGYTKAWIKEAANNADGTPAKDVDGNPIIKINQQVDLKRDGSVLNFYKLVSELSTNNVFYITNKTYDKKSNMVSFNKDFTKVDYNYLTGENDVKKESATYTKSDDVSKNIAFITKPERDFKLGQITPNNLKTNSFYRFSFDIESDAVTNPFNELKFGDEPLFAKKTSNGFVYSYSKTWYGKDFTTKDIMFNINELFNLSQTQKLKIINIKIDLLDSESEYKNVYQDSTPKNISFSYTYHISNCFDGESDFCDALKLWGDSYLDFILTFGAVINKKVEDTIIKKPDTISQVSDENKTIQLPDGNKIANKAKYSKQMILSKNKLEKSKSYKKLITQIDKMVEWVSAKKWSVVLAKIAKINKEKLWDKKEIFEYLEAKIWTKINK